MLNLFFYYIRHISQSGLAIFALFLTTLIVLGYLINTLSVDFLPDNLYLIFLISIISIMYFNGLNLKLIPSGFRNYSDKKPNPDLAKIKKLLKGLEKDDPIRAHLLKGYQGYDKEFNLNGIILDDKVSFINALKPFLKSLDSNKLYHVLPVLEAEMMHENKNFIITPHALKVHSDMNVMELANTLMLGTNNTMLKYHVNSFIKLSLLYRQWHDVKNLVTSKTNMLNTINNLHVDKFDVQSTMADESIIRFKNTKFGGIFFDPNSISNLFITNGPGKNYSISIDDYRADVQFNVKTGDITYWSVIIWNLDNTKLGEFKFEFNEVTLTVIRRYADFVIKFQLNKDNTQVRNIDVKYKFPYIPSKPKDTDKNDKIASADFECYTDSKGIFKVFSAAFCILENGKYVTTTIYISEQIPDVVTEFIRIILKPKYHGYTFYFHNLGKFDGIFLLHKLLSNKIKFRTIMKEDNSIINFQDTNPRASPYQLVRIISLDDR